LLSGAFNAYGESVDRAEKRAAQFQRTIELGRVTGSELAQQFGSVAPIASQAGLSFEELAGGFSTISINGLNASRTATALRGLLTGLLKPSDDLSR